MLGPILLGLAVICGALAFRADEKPVRVFFVAACLLNLLAAVMANHEGNFWKWMPQEDERENYRRD